MKKALKQALINIENSAKFTWEAHEEDNSMLLYMDNSNEFCKYLEERQLYPIGIGVNVPLTGYWSDGTDEPGFKALGFLFHDLKNDSAKWIHIHQIAYERMMLWFYDESVLEAAINAYTK